MEKIAFTIDGDSEGKILLECPFCKSEFKLRAGELQNEEETVSEIFCSYCGLNTHFNEFLTSDVKKQLEAILKNLVIDEINFSFNKSFKKMNRSKHIKAEYKPIKKVNIPNIVITDSPEEEFNCNICGKHVSVIYNAGVSNIFCSFCGVDI